jgi:hypothetical protein
MGEIVLGILIGAGLVTVGKRAYRPALKEGIKLGILATDAVKEAVHEGREKLTDLVAEAKQEAEESKRAAQTDLEAARAQSAD